MPVRTRQQPISGATPRGRVRPVGRLAGYPLFFGIKIQAGHAPYFLTAVTARRPREDGSLYPIAVGRPIRETIERGRIRRRPRRGRNRQTWRRKNLRVVCPRESRVAGCSLLAARFSRDHFARGTTQRGCVNETITGRIDTSCSVFVAGSINRAVHSLFPACEHHPSRDPFALFLYLFLLRILSFSHAPTPSHPHAAVLPSTF